MGENRDKVIDKIRKMFALSAGAGTAEEAHVAMKMAREFMAKFKIEEDEVKTEAQKEEEPIVAMGEVILIRRSWVDQLILTIGENFGVKPYYAQTGYYARKRVIKFFGEESMVHIANLVFEQAVQVSTNLADMYMREEYDRKTAHATPMHARNAYLEGFVRGLREAFREQDSESTALMIVTKVPERVKEAYEATRMKKSSSLKSSGHRSYNAYSTGQKDGQSYGRATRSKQVRPKEFQRTNKPLQLGS